MNDFKRCMKKQLGDKKNRVLKRYVDSLIQFIQSTHQQHLEMINKRNNKGEKRVARYSASVISCEVWT